MWAARSMRDLGILSCVFNGYEKDFFAL
jgi:hypothetical protein